jgi:hypothetical protein
MARHHVLSLAFAGFLGLSACAAQAQSPAGSANLRPAVTKPSDIPYMAFFVAKGEANTCGPGCSEWIAADGKIDLAAAQRLRMLLAKLGQRKLPIFFNSPGGTVVGSMALGRVIRNERIEVSVGRTIPASCKRDVVRDPDCEALMRSGQEFTADLDPIVTWCNSGCVLALSGGAMRHVPPWVKLGVHAIGIDLEKTTIRGAPIAAAIKLTNSRIVDYLHDMGIDQALFDASNAVPHESARYLQRDELIRFGIDTRLFGETSWWFLDKPIAMAAKGFFARTGQQEGAYPNALLRLSCGIGQSMRLTFTRDTDPGPSAARPLRISVNGFRTDLPYGRSGGMEMRTVALSASVANSLDDKSTIEVFNFDPDTSNDQQAPAVLHMAGFSAAYAKLRDACDKISAGNRGCDAADLSPRCVAGPLKTSPAIPSVGGGGPVSPEQ